MTPGPLEPLGIRDRWILGWHEVRQDEGLDPGLRRQPARPPRPVCGCRRRVCEAPSRARPGRAGKYSASWTRMSAPFASAIRFRRAPRVAGEHDRSVRAVEAVGQRQRNERMIDHRARDGHEIVLHDESAAADLVRMHERPERRASFVRLADARGPPRSSRRTASSSARAAAVPTCRRASSARRPTPAAGDCRSPRCGPNGDA